MEKISTESSSSSSSKNSEEIIPETSVCCNLINITLLDNQVNFKKISPFKLNKALNLISDTWEWIKYSNNYQTLIIKEDTEEKLTGFMQLKEIEVNNILYNIIVSKVLPPSHIKGVIYSKSLLPITDEEILNDLKSQNVCAIYRFKKHIMDGSLIESGSFALTFLNDKRPEMVKISFLNLQVYPLFEKPMQCNHCMLIGHTTKKCKVLHETFCNNCFHRTLKDQIHECINSCKNCRGTHVSNLKTCPTFLKEKKILELKASEQISYYEAKTRFNNKTIKSMTTVEESSKNCIQLKEIKNERDDLQSINHELKLLNEEQNLTIKLLTEENQNLKLQLSLVMKKVEISKKLTNEILTQLKESKEDNDALSNINKKNQQQMENMNEMLEQYRTSSVDSHYWTSTMKQFINRNEKAAKEFQAYLKLN